jgi:hypothetical protein
VRSHAAQNQEDEASEHEKKAGAVAATAVTFEAFKTIQFEEQITQISIHIKYQMKQMKISNNY